MKICMIGTGYVGLVSGACFADLGNDVWCVDKDKEKIDLLNDGDIPIYEPGLKEIVSKNYVSGRLKFTTNLSLAVKDSDLIFICVGTPTSKNGSANLKYVYAAAKEISRNINKFKIIINKSTVPISTGDIVEKIISKKVKRKNFEVVSNPEFLREGEAIRDFRFPDRIVIGTNNKKVIKKIKVLYDPLIKKGATFFISTQQIGINPRYYKYPFKFNPERWDSSKENYNPFILDSYLPFGSGGRRCLGQWLAKYEIRTFLTYYLRENLDLELLNPNKKISLKMVCTGLPSQEIKVRFKKKKNFSKKKTI